MFKNLPENTKIILSSTLPLLTVFFLFLIVGQFGFARIRTVREQIANGQKDRAVLTQKLDLLQTVSEIAAGQATIASTAVPGGNSSLAAISQLKTLSATHGVIISNIKAGGEIKDGSGLSRSDISFEAEGARINMITFLKGISGISPLAVTDRIKLSEVGGTVRANVAVKSFWSEFPTKLPATTEAITDLTGDEKRLLTEIAALIQPVFVEIPASVTSARADPFSP